MDIRCCTAAAVAGPGRIRPGAPSGSLRVPCRLNVLPGKHLNPAVAGRTRSLTVRPRTAAAAAGNEEAAGGDGAAASSAAMPVEPGSIQQHGQQHGAAAGAHEHTAPAQPPAAAAAAEASAAAAEASSSSSSAAAAQQQQPQGTKQKLPKQRHSRGSTPTAGLNANPSSSSAAKAAAAAGSGATPPAFSLRAALAPLAQLGLGLMGLLQAWLSRWLLRAGVATGVVLLGLHLLLNKALLPLANRMLLPGLLADASRLSMREVSVGGVSSVFLPGLLGVGPLVTLKQVEVGPGPYEKSFLTVPEVTVSILPAASMHQQRIVLQVTALRPHVTAVQGSNFSWLGYPADTTPSSRDFLPGLTAQQQQQDQGGSEEDGGQAAAATEGEEDEGSEGSEGSGVTLGRGQARQQAAGPPIGRQDSSSTSTSTSTTSSSTTLSGWKQQQGSQARGPPFAAISAGGNGSRDNSSTMWNWWRQKQQQQQQSSPVSDKQDETALTTTAVSEDNTPASSSGPSSSETATDQQQQYVQHEEQLHAQRVKQLHMRQQLQQLAERRASHAAASSSGREQTEQEHVQQQRHVWRSRQPSGRARLEALRLRRQQKQQQQQQQQHWTDNESGDTHTSSLGVSADDTGVGPCAAGGHIQQQRRWRSPQLQQQQLQQQGAVAGRATSSKGSRLPAGSDQQHTDLDSSEHTEAGSSDGSSGRATAAAVFDSNDAVWGSASSERHGRQSEIGTQTDLHTITEESEGSSEATFSSEPEGTDTAAAAESDVLAEAAEPAVPVPQLQQHLQHQQQHGLAEQQQQQQQQQQVQAASALAATQSWLSQRFRAAGTAVVRSMGRQLSYGLNAITNKLSLRVHFPPPALHRVVVAQGQLDVQVHGEPIMRVVRDVGVLVTLGPEYSWLEVQVEGDAEKRHPASVKCTSINPAAKRHLRHVTPGSSSSSTRLRKFSCDVLLPEQPVPAVAAAAAAAAEPESGEQLLALEGGGTVAAGSLAAAATEDAAEGTASAETAAADAVSAEGAGSSPGNAQEQHRAVDGNISGNPRQLSPPAATADGALEGPSVSPAGTAVMPAADTAGASTLGPSSSCSSSNSGFPLETLHLPSGQGGVVHGINFLQPEELTGQQQGQQITALLPQKGGGHLSVRVFHRWAQNEDERDNLLLSVFGRGLDAPLIERLLELPFDIDSGVVDGEIHVAANDDATWEFPAVTGKLTCKDVDLHFWDATDELLGCQMDLLFERDRVYLHKAHGHFGAVPLSVSGDMDLNPLNGQYRLQAAVGPVEVNALRATLAVRPIPFPIAGALRGVLHVTGPLEKPIFSGSASALRPPPALLVGVEDTPALQALLADPSAVVAYDRVPASAANGVFTLDTATEMFVLHSGQAVPAGGGLIQAAGRMWVAAAAESDPRAIAMEAGGNGLNAGALAKPYLLPPEAPAGSPPPHAATVLAGAGPLNVRGSLTGSHLAPATRVDWAAPSSGVTGSAQFSTTALSVACTGNQFSLRASAAVTNPTMEEARNANTQVEATYFGTPRVEAFQMEGSLSGVDMLPLMQTAPPAAPAPAAAGGAVPGPSSISSSSGSLFGPEAPPALVDGSRVRLKVTGGLRLSAVRDEGAAARRQAGLTGQGGYLFTGPVVLDGLRVNQLSLARRLSGEMALTEPRLLLKGRGAGRQGNELLELDLALPPSPLASRPAPGPDGQLPLLLYCPPAFAAAHVVAVQQAPSTLQQQAHMQRPGQQQQERVVEGAGGEGGEGEADRLWQQQQQQLASAAGSAAAAAGGGSASVEAQRVSHVLLRRGDLHFSSTVNASGTAFAAALESLPLDELELGSLRGVLVGAVLDVDLATQTGRLTANLASPRFSGLAGTSLSTNARWERDVVLLERAVLTQPNSRYELAAEYILPPAFTPPASIAQAQQAAAATAPANAAGSHHHHHKHHHHHHQHQHGASGRQHHQQHQVQQQERQNVQQSGVQAAADSAAAAAVASPEDGRWRLQLVVPHAAIEELLPAGQLLRQASRKSARDYSLAKSHFLSGLTTAAISAGEEFSSQVAALAEAAAVAAAAAAAASGQPLPAGNEASSSATASALSLPGLQELRGSWSGRITAVGGGAGVGGSSGNSSGGGGAGFQAVREVSGGVGSSSSSGSPQVEFDINGSGWRAGPYTLDQLSLRGSADAAEGISLDDLKLAVGQAQLSAKGLLGGKQQDAVFSLTDFPAVLLQPLFSALPALQHAAPALDVRGGSSGAPPPGSSSGSSAFSAQASAALSGLSSKLEASLASLGLRLPAGGTRGAGPEGGDPLEPFLASPVSGLLNVRGVLGGSVSTPTGLIKIKLLDGALGRQKLARSTASLALNSKQQLTMDVELAPADSHGFVKLAGSIDLLGLEEGQPGGSSSSGGNAAAPEAGAQAGKGDVGSIAAEVRSSSGGGSGGSGSGSKGKKRKGKGQPAGASSATDTAAAAAKTAAAANGATATVPGSAPDNSSSSSSSSEPYLELGLSVRDGGMSLLTSLAPGLTWGGGSAALNFAATGPATAPILTGSASFNKGSLGTSVLKHPLTQLTGSLAVDGDTLAVSGLEAKVGPKGTLAIRGTLPLTPLTTNSSSSSSSKTAASSAGSVSGLGPAGDRLHASMSGVELRVRNMYSGSLDADLDLRGSLSTPVLGGKIVFSRGTAFLVPPAGSSSATEATATPASSSNSSSSQAELVRTAFAALKAGKARAATAAAADARGEGSSQLPVLLPGQQLMPFMPPAQQQPTGTPAAPGQQGTAAQGGSDGSSTDQTPAPALQLCGLELVLGPELRAVFPVVLNVGVSGNLMLSGNPAQPNGLLPSGVIRLEGGVLNLVATQFRLERDLPNSITFSPEAGLDPLLDLALSSSELRAVIAGRASAWQEHLSLTATGPASAAAGGPAAGGGGGVGGGGAVGAVGGGEGGLVGIEGIAGDVLGSRAVARVFEGRLAEALLAEDGSLSLATLAGNTLGSLLPKLETQGQLGKARWRLVSAASLPSLLMSTDPQASGRNGRGASTASSDAGPRLLRSLALGTEVEVALGRSLVAALSHNMPASASDAGEAGMEVKLSLAITRQLRLLMQQRGLRLAPLVLLQFSSEGIPGAVRQ